MHGTQYHTDITKLLLYTTQEIKIANSFINDKVKCSEPFTKKFLLRVELI